MEFYRVNNDSPKWQKAAYDYIRIDAFVAGQDIPVELEFNGDKEVIPDTLILIEEHKPVSGCRIAWHGDPSNGFAQIQRVATVQNKQREGYGTKLIEEAEKWILEKGYHHILITSQDRALGFYNTVGYTTLPDEQYAFYFPEEAARKKERLAGGAPGPLSFTTVLTEKYI